MPSSQALNRTSPKNFRDFYKERYPDCNLRTYFIGGENTIFAFERIADALGEYVELIIDQVRLAHG